MPDASEPAPEPRPVPPLPTKLTDVRPIAAVGISAWFLAFVVLWLAGDHGEWLWVTLYGTVFGVFFFGVSEWQRAAARRGSRWAQTGFETAPAAEGDEESDTPR